MKNTHNRRQFVKRLGMTGLGFMGLQSFLLQSTCTTSPVLDHSTMKYGDLREDPGGIFKLPKGFSYKIISKKGSKMDDGLLVPGRFDGMATFAGKDGRIIIVRNHEVNIEKKEISLGNTAFGKKNHLMAKIDRTKLYDIGKDDFPGLGGTTTMVYNPQTKKVETQYLSLGGTYRNCAGGPTPWGSWISCEETVVRAGEAGGIVGKDHGYCFEVPASEKVGLVEPIPLKDMGRFNHEAIAVDPKTKIVYLTEDRWDGLFYRFIPNVPGELAKGGQLQALVIKEGKGTDTRNWPELKGLDFPVGRPMEVEWIDLKDVDSPYDELRYEGFTAGAARFARGEGIWWGDGEAYFACTNGGRIMKGQIFRYKPSMYEGTLAEKDHPGTIELFVEPNNISILQNCDNLTIAPWGDIVTCEDTDAPSRIIGITPKGEYYLIAQNVGYDSELSGAVFAPDGKTLFVNIQHEGLTLAITGNW
ncbi:MAG: alkaline phosphatase PhoX [Chitinophagales bacterium]